MTRMRGLVEANARVMATASVVGHAVARHGVAVSILLAMAFLSYRLMLAPVHGVRDVSMCDRAYAEARTHEDTLAVAFLSYPDPAGRSVQRRCGGLRRLTVGITGR